jgi:hypothetical protein
VPEPPIYPYLSHPYPYQALIDGTPDPCLPSHY